MIREALARSGELADVAVTDSDSYNTPVTVTTKDIGRYWGYWSA